jgi:hypothetical protein
MPVHLISRAYCHLAAAVSSVMTVQLAARTKTPQALTELYTPPCPRSLCCFPLMAVLPNIVFHRARIVQMKPAGWLS